MTTSISLVCRVFRQLHHSRTMNSRQLQCLLEVAAHPGITTVELSRRLSAAPNHARLIMRAVEEVGFISVSKTDPDGDKGGPPYMAHPTAAGRKLADRLTRMD